ncbi:MAG TPA: CoA pyrophosphatase [Ignavibacteriaceae bacterium]
MNYRAHFNQIISSGSSIIGKENYLNSAVLIPIIILDDQEFILFQKRSINVRQPGEISFPGGHFDQKTDSNFLDTAVRETCEELGIKKNDIDILGKIGTLVAPMGVIVESYLGILKIDSLDKLAIDKSEVDEVFLIPLHYFIQNKPDQYFTRLELHPYLIKEDGKKEELLPVKELGLPEKYSSPWTNGKHRVLVYKTAKEVIWGITAELIYELSNRMRELIDKKL